jgi:hypothetical protein
MMGCMSLLQVDKVFFGIMGEFFLILRLGLDLPAKIRLRAGGGMSNGYDMQQFVGRHHHQSQSQRSRGGEHVEPDEDPNEEEDEEEEEDENSYMENPEDLDDEESLNIDDPLSTVPQSPGNSGLAGTCLLRQTSN